MARRLNFTAFPSILLLCLASCNPRPSPQALDLKPVKPGLYRADFWEQVAIEAPHDGTVIINTEDDEVAVYRGRLHQGQVLVLVPHANTIRIDNKPVRHRRLRPSRDYRDWFISDSSK